MFLAPILDGLLNCAGKPVGIGWFDSFTVLQEEHRELITPLVVCHWSPSSITVI